MPRRTFSFSSSRLRARARLRAALWRGGVALALGLSPLLTLGTGSRPEPARFPSLFAAAAEPTIRVEGPARVVDGDTLEIAGEKVRLLEIDAPERAQSCRDAAGADYACGTAATQALSALIDGAPVACAAHERDVYGRLLGRCEAHGRDLGEAMVAQGRAVVYRKIAIRYGPAEDAARAAGRGLWAGDFETPWDWRAGKRLASARPSQDLDRDLAAAKGEPPEGCAIKGNVSDAGRIYHRPGEASYERTRIDPARGERWFCTVADAESAGWRPVAR